MDRLVAEILRYAERHALDSSVVILACAEILAITAVQLDASSDALSTSSLEDRLHEFLKHVTTRYHVRSAQRQVAVMRGA